MTHPTWTLAVFSSDSDWLVEDRYLGAIPLVEAQEAFAAPPDETMIGLEWVVGPAQAEWLRSRVDEHLDFDFDRFSYFVSRLP